MADKESPHICFVRGMELCEDLEGVEHDLGLLKLSDEKLKTRTIFKRPIIEKSVQRGLEGAVQTIIKQKCLDESLRDSAHKVLTNLALSAKERDFNGIQERLYDLRERIGISRFRGV